MYMFNNIFYVFLNFQKLILLCDCVLYKDQQQEQIHFLHTLCAQLNNQQNFAIMFLSDVII